MKICRFSINRETFNGVLENDRVTIFENNRRRDESYPLSDVKLLAPVNPSKIVCVGRNYAEHAAELGNEVPTEPLLFLKAPSAVINNGDLIVLPKYSKQVEHEGELAIVIGRRCRALFDDEDPRDHILGYACLNDITARDLQRKDGQFTRSKSFDTFCPVGPFIETDVDIKNGGVTTRVNGVTRQSGKFSQMVFPVDFLIRYISNMMTLMPGDVIATGTPSGVGRLESGDVCEIEIDGIGVLKNSVE
jgi:2-keto-4-pentenoate hydratase/2-oxohepta-3-ene-1,7-dioic acid hydratase in catechol pathway